MTWIPFIFFALVQIALAGLFGGVLLYLVIFPAFRMAAPPPRKAGLGLWVSILLAATWSLGSVLAGASLSQAIVPYYSDSPPPPIRYEFVVLAVLTQTAFGALCGLVARLGAQLPHIVKLTALAGLIVGSLNTIPTIQRWPWFGPAPFLVFFWFAVPVAALYVSAAIQSWKLTRFRRGSCVPCGQDKVGRLAQCPECKEPTRQLCTRCRRLVNARPGDRCPRCKKAKIAAQCWACGYDWRGLDSPRCPECGVWKPTVAVEPPPNPS